MDRIYHPVDLWEEMEFNMWGVVSDKAKALSTAIEFTGNHTLYGSYMRRVTAEWRHSCENALTDRTINQKAWLGHAACALAIQIPENIIREAWGYLSEEQRRLANGQAARAISDWKGARADTSIHTDVGGQVLLRWDS